MHHKLHLLFLAALIVLFAGANRLEAKPNIILITTDDQRADEIFGMPALQEKLVKAGTTFTQAFSTFPLCCPARASIMSGQYAHNHHVLSNVPPLGGYQAFDSSNSLATWLQGAGYQTAFVGKYLNGYSRVIPQTVPPGWMDWHALLSDDYVTFSLRESTGGPPVTVPYTGRYQTDLLASKAVDVIDRLMAPAKPLFLWVAFFAPHAGSPSDPGDPAIRTPAVAPRHRDDFAGTPLRKQEYDASFDEVDVSDKPGYVRARPRLSPALQGRMTELYQQRLESLLAVDEGIARIFAAVEASGQLGNTLFVFTSDNGFMLGEHRFPAGKEIPYTPSARVPLIVRGPGFPADVRLSPLVALHDLAPTFLEPALATAGLPQDGISLSAIAANPAAYANRHLVMEHGPRSKIASDPWFYRGIRSARWVYLKYEETGEVEMYDVVHDPFQLQNVARNPAYAAQRRLLVERFARFRNCAGAACR